MASYLEKYGALEEHRARRNRIIKISVIAVVCAVIVGLVLYALFKNFSQEQTVKAFVQHLANHEYQDAYRMFGCTEATPCRDYSFPKFMEDWGPNSGHGNAAGAKIATSQSCGNGVFIRLDFPSGEPMKLLVERNTNIISFAPSDWIECPGKHWRIGTFLRGLFNR